MTIYKPPVVRRPIKLQNNASTKIVYRIVKNIQHLKNTQELGTSTIKRRCCMVRKQGVYWVIV
ncbi:hypothetical protein [Nostoc sp. WHI]|uniref:hypothetical protein n=1 Tax=Nostoc sp. WHI TaxID=2650611 RepID=UPI0018C64A9B|nr:hypothetical protein [Nostoc sp. WHI]MBG1268976.1 hypothetical protein [Nostoc sp. WHI]